MNEWSELQFWQTGEWQVIEEKLADLDAAGIQWNPGREKLFASMAQVPLSSVKVAIIGQDPYPNPEHATGIAFDLPPTVKDYPPTFVNIIKEYERDLHFMAPENGSLLKWCAQGVFLWNAIPTCNANKPKSHDWTEYQYLTKEIVEVLSDQGSVLVFLGSIARSSARFALPGTKIIETSHPSPLGVKRGFEGSRLFTTINAYLTEPIDWRL